VFCIFLVAFGPWSDHVKQFWEHKGEENILFVTYEDLHKVCEFWIFLCLLTVSFILPFFYLWLCQWSTFPSKDGWLNFLNLI